MAEAGEILRVAVHYIQANAGDMLNVFTFQIASGNEDDSRVLDDFADWVENVWGVDWQDFATLQCELDRVEIDVLNTNGTVDRNIGSQGINIVGSNSGELAPAACAGYLKADTAIPKTRGSKYVPGLFEGILDTGELNAETLADLLLMLVTAFSVFEGTVSGMFYQPGVLSRTAVEFVPFEEAGYVTDIPAYQRRRKPNVGS